MRPHLFALDYTWLACAVHIDTAPPNIFALHKFTPQRPQSAPIFTSQPAKLEIFQRHKVGTGFARQPHRGWP
jgi:hypothetical protein